MAIEEKSDGRTVQLKRVRLSFTRRLKTATKTSTDSEKETYGCNVVLEKDSPNFDENHAKVMSAIKAAGKLAFKNEDAYVTIAEDAPKRVCYRDGTKWKNKEHKVYAGYENAKAFSGAGPSGGLKRPKLYDRRKRRLESQLSHDEKVRGVPSFPDTDIDDLFYSGVYADVIVSFYGTDKGSRGIFCTIDAIRSHQEGDRIGGGVHVDDDDFDDLEDDDSFDSGSKELEL
jgi:hypothetical protein